MGMNDDDDATADVSSPIPDVVAPFEPSSPDEELCPPRNQPLDDAVDANPLGNAADTSRRSTRSLCDASEPNCRSIALRPVSARVPMEVPVDDVWLK